MALDLVLYPMIDELVACLRGELDDAPCFTGAYAGSQVSADFCSCKGNGAGCGMAWVRIQRVYPSEKPPTLATNPTANTPIAATLEVGTFRCRATLKSNGAPPDVVDQANDVMRLTSDLLAVRRAIRCCKAITERTHAIGSWQPQDSGDCGGGTWTVAVQLVR